MSNWSRFRNPRSPSTFCRMSSGGAASGGGGGGTDSAPETADGAWGGDREREPPHWLQNRLPEGETAPHEGQGSPTGGEEAEPAIPYIPPEGGGGGLDSGGGEGGRPAP